MPGIPNFGHRLNGFRAFNRRDYYRSARMLICMRLLIIQIFDFSSTLPDKRSAVPDKFTRFRSDSRISI